MIRLLKFVRLREKQAIVPRLLSRAATRQLTVLVPALGCVVQEFAGS